MTNKKSLLCLSFLCGMFFQTESAEQSQVIWNNIPEALAPGVTHHELESEHMKRTVGYTVYLPDAYHENSESNFPVIYFLHGYGGNENADGPGFSGIVSDAIRKGEIKPAICVFPNGGKSFYRDHPDTGIRVESMLIKELIPTIDRKYRTLADREHRVIAGFSMGGAGALRLSLVYPDKFSAAASFAAAIGKPWDKKFPSEFNDEFLSKVTPEVRLLMVSGTEDDVSYPVHLEFVKKLYAQKFNFTYSALKGEEHNLGRYYQLSGKQMVKFLTSKW